MFSPIQFGHMQTHKHCSQHMLLPLLQCQVHWRPESAQWQQQVTINNNTARMYWRQASIQDGQASGDATVLKQFFHDNFVIFHWRSKRIAFLESVNFLRVSVCKFSIFVTVRWPLFGTLQRPISAKSLVTRTLVSRLAKGIPPESWRSIGTSGSG